ncbi:MAG: hotdog fold thioesterase [Acidimicrobiia bacterium]
MEARRIVEGRHLSGDTRIGDLLHADPYAVGLGAELTSADPIVLAMTVGADHINFHGVAHGGAIFSLADCAFSLASNAAGPAAVAIDTHLAITAAARQGDVLEATAEEITRGRSLATYRVTVSRPADARIVAMFTGTVFIRDGR